MTRHTQELIKQAMAAAGITQTEMARRLGVTKARISQVLNAQQSSGKRRGGPPSNLTVEAFARVLEVPAATLRCQIDTPAETVMDEYLKKIKSFSPRIKFPSSDSEWIEYLVDAWSRPMLGHHEEEDGIYSNGLTRVIDDELHIKLQTFLDLITANLAFEFMANCPRTPKLFRAAAKNLSNRAFRGLAQSRLPRHHRGKLTKDDLSAAYKCIDNITHALRAYENI